MYLQFGINQVEAGNEEKRKTGWKPPKVELVVTANGVHFTETYVGSMLSYARQLAHTSDSTDLLGNLVL